VFEWLGALGGIVLVDLALSGDNALVIGAAAANLPESKRRAAIMLGGVMAIVLRVALGTAATLLLGIPLLQTVGGAVLLIIAVRILAARKKTIDTDDTERSHHKPEAHGTGTSYSFTGALATILVADVTMSLDNVLAVGALAAGNLPLLALGLLLSMSLLLVGSTLVARLIDRMTWLLDAAALVLGWTAAHLILEDPRVSPVLSQLPWRDALVPAVALVLVLAADLYLRVRRRAAERSERGQVE
jgi:YjbE family integral membrane protein